MLCDKKKRLLSIMHIMLTCVWFSFLISIKLFKYANFNNRKLFNSKSKKKHVGT